MRLSDFSLNACAINQCNGEVIWISICMCVCFLNACNLISEGKSVCVVVPIALTNTCTFEKHTNAHMEDTQ